MTTTYQYDDLDRVTLKSYVDGHTPPLTSAVTTCYDGQVAGSGDGVCANGSAPNSIGRLTDTKNSVSENHITGYTALGQILSSVQTTAGQPYGFSYVYNLAGALQSTVYPSGRTVMNGYDTAGRLCSVSGTTATPPMAPYPCTVTGGAPLTEYANNVAYTPQGSLQSMARGDGLTEAWTYNSRLQAKTITVGPGGSAFGMTLYYCPGHTPGNETCGTNNGNVVSQQIATPGVFQDYSYDKLNRLLSIAEPGNSQTWDYDSRGNRYWTNHTGSFFLSPFLPGDPSGYNNQNQLVTAGSGAQYADRGNQTALGAMTFTYGDQRAERRNDDIRL